MSTRSPSNKILEPSPGATSAFKPSNPGPNSNQQGPGKKENWLRRQYVTVKSLILEHTSGRLHRLLEQEFNPLFTFSLVALFQVLYFAWLMSRGSLGDANIIIRFGAHVHIAALIIGGAAARCFFAWLVYPVAEGEAGPPPGVIFDYPCQVAKAKSSKNSGEDHPTSPSLSVEKKVH